MFFARLRLLLLALALLCALIAAPSREEDARLEREEGRASAPLPRGFPAAPSFAGELELLVALDAGGAAWTDERVATLERALAGTPGVERTSELWPLRHLTRASNLRLLCAFLESGPPDETARVTAELERVLAAARREGERAYVVGWPRLRAESAALARENLARMLPLLAGATGLIAWLFLGTSAATCALLVAAGATAFALSLHRLVGAALTLEALPLVPILWAAAALDVLPLAARARTLVSRGATPGESLRRARAELAGPCLAASLAAAIAFGLLGAFAREGALKSLGLASAAGVLAAHLLAFGPAAGLLAQGGARARGLPRWPSALALAALRPARRAPRRVLAAWAVLAAAALAGVAALRTSSAFPRLFAADVPLAQDLEHLAAALGTDLGPVRIDLLAADDSGRRPVALLSAVFALAHMLHTRPEVRAVLPVDAFEDALALMRSLPSSPPPERDAALLRLLASPGLASWIDGPRGRAGLEVHLAPASFDQKRELFGRLEHFDETMLGHHSLRLSGPAHGAHRAEAQGRRAAGAQSLLCALVLAAVLAIALRSARAWTSALALCVLPPLLAVGAMGLAAVPWSAALLPLPTALLAAGAGGSLHLLWTQRAPASGRTPRRAAWTALLAATALSVACASTLSSAALESSQDLGLFLGLGFLTALAAQLTLLPALVRGSRRRAPR